MREHMDHDRHGCLRVIQPHLSGWKCKWVENHAGAQWSGLEGALAIVGASVLLCQTILGWERCYPHEKKWSGEN